MFLARTPELGMKPVPLTVKLPPMQQGRVHLAEGLRQLYRNCELTDIVLTCGGSTFPAHCVVLAAQSQILKEDFRSSLGSVVTGPDAGNRAEMRLTDITHPLAVELMLDYIYQADASMWDGYRPRTLEVNTDVLRLARQFGLPGLVEHATHWLAKDITTNNAVERLTICEDFHLTELRDRILEQIVHNRQALAEVAQCPQLTWFPQIMRALLQQTAAASEPDGTPQPEKRSPPDTPKIIKRAPAKSPQSKKRSPQATPKIIKRAPAKSPQPKKRAKKALLPVR